MSAASVATTKYATGYLYFLSREKDNMKLEVISNLSFDAAPPINTGILTGEMVATSHGVSVR